MLGAAGHPLTGFLSIVDAKFERTPTADRAEHLRHFFVILELQPVDQAIFVPMQVHALQERLPVEARKHLRPEMTSERGVALGQNGRRKPVTRTDAGVSEGDQLVGYLWMQRHLKLRVFG